MPNCFQLIDKKTSEPASLRDVNNELWAFFNQEPCDKWCCGWYYVIGLGIAVGKFTLSSSPAAENYLEYYFQDPELNDGFQVEQERYQNMLLILEYLRENYESRAFASVG